MPSTHRDRPAPVCSPRLLALLCALSALAGMANIALLTNTAPPLQHPAPGAQESSTSPSSAKRRPKLADGCYHVFVDAGSNIGMHARFLLEPKLYPKAWIARKFFAAHFGPEPVRDNRDFCVFAFEPNPVHRKRHQDMADAYAAMGWRYHFLPAGVGDRNGQLAFYDIGDELGFTAVPKRSCGERKCPQIRVPVYRLADWIEDEVLGRTVPLRAHGGGGYVPGPRVAMKMDIEMLEWIVMPDLITSGVLCQIDAVMGEFHLAAQWHRYPVAFPNPGGGDWTLHNYTEAEDFMNHMLGMIERNHHCKTKLEMRDDESHADDGMPLPKPPS